MFHVQSITRRWLLRFAAMSVACAALAPVARAFVNDLRGISLLGNKSSGPTTYTIKGTTAAGTLLFNVSVAIPKGTGHAAAAGTIAAALNGDAGFMAAGLTAAFVPGPPPPPPPPGAGGAKATGGIGGMPPGGAVGPITSWVTFSPAMKYPGGDTKVSSSPAITGLYVGAL